MMTTFYALTMLYVHPNFDRIISLTFAVTRISQARYYDELPSGIGAKNMAGSMW